MMTIAQDPFKEPLKGLFLNGLLITGEGRTARFRPEVDNGCQATSIHPLPVQKYNPWKGKPNNHPGSNDNITDFLKLLG